MVFGEFGVEEDHFGVEPVGDGGVGSVSGEGVSFGEDVSLVVGASLQRLQESVDVGGAGQGRRL